MGKDSAPAPQYDPMAAANAQGAANVQTARTQGKINNPNIFTPYGNQTVTWGQGFDQAGYDAALAKYQQDIANYSPNPVFFRNNYGESGWTTPGSAPVAPTRDQFTTQADQPTITQTLSPDQQAILIGQQNISRGLLNTGQQALGTAQTALSRPFDLGGVQDIENRAYGAQTERLDPLWQRNQEQLDSQLANQGITRGSQAYDNAYTDFNKAKTDAYQQANLAAIATMPQTYQLARSAYTQPLDIVNALRTGSQVQNPQFQQYNGATVGQTPIMQAAQLGNQYQMNAYNQGVAQNNATESGLFSLGGMALMAMAMSDRRLKSNIVRIGTHPLGIGIYDYDIFGQRQRGVMADEVLTVRPEAVLRHPSGYLMVNYGRL